jgi:hypothetical protein
VTSDLAIHFESGHHGQSGAAGSNNNERPSSPLFSTKSTA